jgi:hypothetical protein
MVRCMAETGFVHVGTTLAVVHRCDAGQGLVGGILGQIAVSLACLEVFHGRVTGRLAEDQQVKQRVGTETVGTVHRGTGAFAASIEARHDGIHVAVLRHDDTTGVMGRDTAHLVVTGRHDRQRLLEAIDTGKLQADFADTRQALHDGRPDRGG